MLNLGKNEYASANICEIQMPFESINVNNFICSLKVVENIIIIL